MHDGATSELVQPIIVARTGSHEDAIRCVAEASLRAYLAAPDLPEWRAWLAGVFVKTVRRAKAAEYEKAKGAGALAEVRHGDARAVAFPPRSADALPRPIARLQVSGTELERRGWGEQAGARVMVALNGDLEMSTGKAAAQTAHAIWAIWLQLSQRERQRWVAEDLAFRLTSVAAADMSLGRLLGIGPDDYGWEPSSLYVAVRDAGRTEVEPGSLTAVGVAAR